MKELYDQIVAEYGTFSENANAQADKGNKAAGARARKSASVLVKLLKEFRKASIAATKGTEE